MENKICQSCGMPIKTNDDLGTNKDGSINNDYCKYCYKDGEFIDKVTMEEYIEMCSQYGKQAGMTNEEMKAYCQKLFPTLKRWQSKRMNKNELLALLATLKIDKNEFWILSSGGLVLRDIFKDAGDLDIAVTPKGLAELKQNYHLIAKERGWYTVNDKVECVCDGEIADLKYKPERLANGYLVQNIVEYLEHLKTSTREKDIARIPLVEEYINKR